MNDVKVGMRFLLDNRVGECIDAKYEWPDLDYMYSRLGTAEEFYKFYVKFSDTGETVKYTGWEKAILLEHLIYQEDSGFEIGDYFEIKRAGLQPDLRGRLISVDELADRWPYRIADEDGNSASFSYYELTKIHSVISQQRAPKAIETLRSQIEIAKAELEALETALEVLLYASA